jgi:hypothetical protein
LWFLFASLWWLMRLKNFSCVYHWPFIYPLSGNVYSSPLHIKKLNLFNCVGIVLYSGFKFLLGIWLGNVFLILWVVFYFLCGGVWSTKAFNFEEDHFRLLLFMLSVL